MYFQTIAFLRQFQSVLEMQNLQKQTKATWFFTIDYSVNGFPMKPQINQFQEVITMIHTEQDDRFMRIAQVAKYCTVTTQTIRNWIKEKTFPKGNKISEKVTLWRKSEIDDYLQTNQ